ncbi:hypothetical protein Q428_00390 [Fervidicella metallireducens AeB]|uniref:Spore germination protein n=1 Tax=Fervidicella metallireducens AeB TaxID=1403537 RepID=A0A017S124_9CLOT|nr:Ger(x)C family spore germination protein [Fervidicella metallireducens]EYE89875.1 hypothetical protein Q428_00390 [Fervidicella metallireducens AeB]
MKKRYKLLSILLLVIIFFTGCWDKVEIENRAFIVSIAVDALTEKNPNASTTQGIYEDTSPIMKGIFTVISPQKLASGDPKPYEVLKSQGLNLSNIVVNLSNKFGRSPFYAHTRVFLLGEGLLKNEDAFLGTLDVNARFHEFNRQMYVVAVKGNIDEIYNTDLKLDDTPSEHIKNIIDGAEKLGSSIKLDLSSFLSSLRDNGSVLIPCIEVKNGEMTASGLAIVSDYKFQGYIPDKYIRGYACLINRLKGGRKVVEDGNKEYSFSISSSNRRIWLVDKNKPKYRISVEMEGDLYQYSFNEELMNPEKIEDVKKLLEDSLKLELEEEIKYFQNDVGKDFLGIGEYTKKYHNKFFKEHEKDWDETFKNAEFQVDVEMFIRRIGPSR